MHTTVKGALASKLISDVFVSKLTLSKAWVFLLLVLFACSTATSPLPNGNSPETPNNTNDGSTPEESPDGSVPITPPSTDVPVFTSSTPASPANNNTPTISGTAPAGSTVSLFDSAACMGTKLGDVTADAGGAFSLQINVGDNTTTVVSALSTTDGTSSGCTTTNLTYIEDSTAPASPSITGTTPASPANQVMITVDGTAETVSTVTVYTTADCSGATAGTALAAANGTFSSGITVTAGATTPLSAKATDAAGNASGCSTASSYSALPDAPTLIFITPTGPANNNNPVISGAGPHGATVQIFDSAGCIGTKLAETTIPNNGSFTLPVNLADNTTTTLSALVVSNALNSACTAMNLIYVEDSAPPSTPSITSTSPSSPSNQTILTISGSAEANATVTLYKSPDCSSNTAGTTLASGAGTFSFSTTVVADVSTPFTVNVQDAASNTSACSSALNFVNDSTPPSAASLSSLTTSPANNNSPTVQATTESGATVRIFADSGCAGSTIGTGVAPSGSAFSIALTVTDNQTISLYTTTTDAVGNAGTCTSSGLSYTEDSTAPSAPAALAFTPVSPSPNLTPSLSGTAESGASVKIYKNAACTGSPAQTVTSTGTFSGSVTSDANATTTFYASATDAAGNISTCSSAASYLHDNIPPLTPTAVVVTPMPSGAGQNVNHPTVTANTDPLTSVSLFHTGDCSGVADSTGISNGSGAVSLVATVSDNATPFPFTVQATDAAGNKSCSSATANFIENTPVLTGTINYSGTKTGRVYVTISYSGGGNETLVGSAIGTTGTAFPRTYTVRGLGYPGNYSARFWMDTLGTGVFNAAVDPFVESSNIAISGTTTHNTTLVDPAAAVLTAPTIQAVFTGEGGLAAVLFDRLKDGSGNDLADAYEIFESTSAIDANSPGAAAKTISTGDVAFFHGLSGTHYFRVRALRDGTPGPISGQAQADVVPAGGATTVTGTVNIDGTPPAGTLFVILFSQSLGAFGAAITGPTNAQSFSISGVADGNYQQLVFVDVNDNGQLDAADIGIFDATASLIATVASGSATLSPMTISTQPAVAAIQTSTNKTDNNTPSYSLQFVVQANGKMPVLATVTDGVSVSPPIDLGPHNNGFGPPMLRASWTPWATPVIGDSYTISVTYSDGSTATLTPTVSGLPALPTALSPIGIQPGTTTNFNFTWSAPVPAPAVYAYSLSIWGNGGGDVWSLENIPSDTTTMLFNDNGQASTDPLTSGNQYTWRIDVRDLFGNRASHQVTFKAQN